MKTIGAFDAKTHLSRLLDEVANGETYVITKRGTPVARLLPPENGQHRDANAAVDAMREFRQREKITLGDLSIRELIEDREDRGEQDIVAEWQEYRRKHNITLGGDITIREMIEDGRKY